MQVEHAIFKVSAKPGPNSVFCRYTILPHESAEHANILNGAKSGVFGFLRSSKFSFSLEDWHSLDELIPLKKILKSIHFTWYTVTLKIHKFFLKGFYDIFSPRGGG